MNTPFNLLCKKQNPKDDRNPNFINQIFFNNRSRGLIPASWYSFLVGTTAILSTTLGAWATPIQLTNAKGKTIEVKLILIGEKSVDVEFHRKKITIQLDQLDEETREKLAPEKWALGYVEGVETLVPRPKDYPAAGKRIQIPMPELGTSIGGAEAQFTIEVGANVSPMRPVPLFIWFAQASGADSDIRNRSSLLGEKAADFVCVFLPYPGSYKSSREYNQAITDANNVKDLEKMHEAMLGRLTQMFPNLDPRLGIVGGFSNGAHTVSTHLANKFKPLTNLCNCYILVEGGSNYKKSFPRYKNDSMLLVFGKHFREYGVSKYLEKEVKRAGFKNTWIDMPGVGHEFPEMYEKQVSKHITEVMIPRHLHADKKK